MKAVILAGGTGTRLWPMSRDLKPKQFHAFVGGKTMLQHTFERLSFLKPKDIFVAANFQYEAMVREQLKRLPKDNLWLEPSTRDTGPCITFAAAQLAKRGFEKEVMAVVYADHLIQNPEGFEKALRFAEKHVRSHRAPAVIAARAKYPNPNLGYIKIGRPVSEGKDFEVYELERFVEKPNIETAKKFLTSFKYLWNTGLYVFRVSDILALLKRHAPLIYQRAQKTESYGLAPKISIDYAVMEKLRKGELHVIPADFGWNDVGNWAALHEELAQKLEENVTQGQHIGLETEGSVVLGSDGKLIVTYGVKNMVIVDTPEALLVMPKEKAAEVKKVIEELKKNNKGKYL